MKQINEVSNFKKSYRYYVVGLILILVYTAYLIYFSYGFVTIELLIATMFFVFLSAIVYLGSLVIELDTKVQNLKKEIELIKE